jgi:hypothetical protein
MRKRLVNSTAVILACYFAFIAYYMFFGGPSAASCQRLEVGMSKFEVRCIVGPWPDKSHQLIKGQIHEEWFADDGILYLAFDDNDRLVWKDWFQRQGQRAPLYDRIAARIWPPPKVRE